MSNGQLTHVLTMTVDRLSAPESLKGICHHHRDGSPLPSGKVLEEIISLARAILFPGYYGNSSFDSKTIRYHIGVNVEKLHRLLSDQIEAGLCFSDCCSEDAPDDNTGLSERAEELSAELISRLPEIRSVLSTDVTAAYYGELRRGHLVLSHHQDSCELSSGSRALSARGAAHTKDYHRDGSFGDRNRHPSRSIHWQILHNRPWHGSGDRRDMRHRKQCQDIPRSDARRQELPARQYGKPYKGHTAPSYNREQRGDLCQCHNPGTCHDRRGLRGGSQ